MLTFFRRIRKGLVDGGATRKYLFYAVGEIALVVIGILIALQVNNWNETRKTEVRTEQLRKESAMAIYADLHSDLANFDLFIEQLEIQYQSGTKVLHFYENPEIYFYDYNTLFPHVNSVLSVSVIVERSQNTFDGIKTAGGLGILSDKPLVEMLMGFYPIYDRRIANFNELPKEARSDYRKAISQTHNLKNLVGFYEEADWKDYKPDDVNMKRIYEIEGATKLISSITISSIVNLEFFKELKIQAQSIISYMEENYEDFLTKE